jgi:hypothetical protein
MVARANRRNATASRSIANDASAAAVEALDTPVAVDAFAASSSSADDGEHLDDFLLSGSSPLDSPDITNAIVGETPNDVDVSDANDCDDTSVNDKEEDVDVSEFLPNAAVNDDTILVDAPSNDANKEGEDTNMEEDTSLDAQDDTPANDSDNADKEGEPLAELWDLVKIYTAKDILKSNAVKCMGDKCRLVACSICPSMSSDADGDATDEEEEEGVDGMWELIKIYTVKELKKSKPIMCSTEGCNHVACSRWESTEGGKPWNSCLDCQEA